MLYCSLSSVLSHSTLSEMAPLQQQLVTGIISSKDTNLYQSGNIIYILCTNTHTLEVGQVQRCTFGATLFFSSIFCTTNWKDSNQYSSVVSRLT